MSDKRDPMTKAQREAACKAWEILGEHFDQVLLVLNWETEGECGQLSEAHEVFWHGGSMVAIGMARFAEDRIMRSGNRYVEPSTGEANFETGKE